MRTVSKTAQEVQELKLLMGGTNKLTSLKDSPQLTPNSFLLQSKY